MRHNAILPRSRVEFPSYVVWLADFMRTGQWATGRSRPGQSASPPWPAIFPGKGHFNERSELTGEAR